MNELDNVSEHVMRKALDILNKQNSIKLVSKENELYIFIVTGKTDEYEVKYDKFIDIITCSCRYGTSKGNICSHGLAAYIYYERNLKSVIVNDNNDNNI